MIFWDYGTLFATQSDKPRAGLLPVNASRRRIGKPAISKHVGRYIAEGEWKVMEVGAETCQDIGGDIASGGCLRLARWLFLTVAEGASG